MNTAKIVFLGAGSMSFGLSTFRDFFTTKELKGSTLCLVDLNEENLSRMHKLALRMNEESKAGIILEATTDRRKALKGADFIISSIAIDRNRLWRQDFEVPKKYGIRHTLGENGGPGGLFFTMRTIPLIMDIARDIEELCPNAYFFNFSNPESRIILALGQYTNVKCMGLCHGVFMGMDSVSHIMGLDRGNIEVKAAGLNHFQWLLEIRDRETGKDLRPLLKEKEKDFDPRFQPLLRKLYRAFGYYPTCSDDHTGEYLAYGWEAGEEGYNYEGDEKGRKELKTEVEAAIAGKRPLDDWFEPSGEREVQAITGILHNKRQLIEAGVVYNKGVIRNLPQNAAVEVPVMVDANGIQPVAVGDLPDGIARLLAMQVSVQQMAVEAAVSGSKELALQALLIDPVINRALS